MRRFLGGGVAIADAVGIGAPVGVFAMAVLAEMAPFAFAAHHVMLHEYEVAFLKALAPGELAARFGDGADVLVPHDYRRAGWRRLIELDVGAADARHLHLHQCSIVSDIRHRKFADLRLAWPRSYRRLNFLHRRFSRASSAPEFRMYRARAPIRLSSSAQSNESSKDYHVEPIRRTGSGRSHRGSGGSQPHPC